MNSQKAFTLIELLVVILVIGILAAITLVSLSSSKERAQDSLRKSDLRQVQSALALYIDNTNSLYPDNHANDKSVGAGNTKGAKSYLGLSTILFPIYLPKFPNDPDYSATGSYQFRYLTDTARKSYEMSTALERCTTTSCSDKTPEQDGGNDPVRLEIGTLQYKNGASFVHFDTNGSI